MLRSTAVLAAVAVASPGTGCFHTPHTVGLAGLHHPDATDGLYDPHPLSIHSSNPQGDENTCAPCGDIRVTLTPSDDTVLSGDVATLNWANLPQGDEFWAAFYSPPDQTHKWHLDYVDGIADLDGETGQKITITNLRKGGWTARLFNGGYDCICEANIVDFTHGTAEPTGPHATLLTNGDIQVVWKSGVTDVATSKLVVTPNSGSAATYTPKDTWSYAARDMCQTPATENNPWRWIHPGYFRKVTIPRAMLTDGATLAFDVMPERTWTWGPENLSQKRKSVIMFGDLGVSSFDDVLKAGTDFKHGTPKGTATGHFIGEHFAKKGRLSLTVHIGDLSYAQGVGMVWDRWHDQLNEAAMSAPYMVSIGNHEYCYNAGGQHDVSGGDTDGHSWEPTWGNFNTDSGGECGLPTAMRFPDAPESPLSNGVFWYSFDFGQVHYILLSSEHDWYDPDSAMRQFLASDLASVDRVATPWLVVGIHRPPYTAEPWEDDQTVCMHLREALDPIFKANKVNLVVAGHDHIYERFCAANMGQCTGSIQTLPYTPPPKSNVTAVDIYSPEAPVYMLVGSGGLGPDNGTHSDPVWKLRELKTWGVLEMVDPLPGETQLSFTFHAVDQQTQAYSVQDAFTVNQYADLLSDHQHVV